MSEPNTKREAKERIAELDVQFADDVTRRDKVEAVDLRRYYNYSAVACSAEASRLRALLPTLPDDEAGRPWGQGPHLIDLNTHSQRRDD